MRVMGHCAIVGIIPPSSYGKGSSHPPHLAAGGCSALRGIADIISNHFFIAMIQGTLKYAWESAQVII